MTRSPRSGHTGSTHQSRLFVEVLQCDLVRIPSGILSHEDRINDFNQFTVNEFLEPGRNLTLERVPGNSNG